MRRSPAPKTRRSPASESPAEPVSETRPIAAPAPNGAPSPLDQIRMGELADRYCRIRAEEARLNDERTPVTMELISLMKKLDRTSIPTKDGMVSFRAATNGYDEPDVDAMVEILKSRGIEIPKKKRAGSPDRLEFRLAR